MHRRFSIACFVQSIAICTLFTSAAFSETLKLVETDASISVERDGRQVLRYNKIAPPVPDGIDPIYARTGFLHPVATPSGAVATAVYPQDHAHQSGIFAAWVKAKYDERPVDFWNIAKRSGRVSHLQVNSKASREGEVSFSVQQRHHSVVQPEVDILQETWEVTVYEGSELANWFDIQISQVALTDKPLKVNKYHYGGFAVRGPVTWIVPKKTGNQTASRTSGKSKGDKRQTLSSKKPGMLNDWGSDRTAGNHQPTRWASMWGEVDGKPVSLSVLSHPKNMRAPQTARLHPTKPYFCFAPCVAEGFVIDKDHPFTSRYRIVVSDSMPDQKMLDTLWQDFGKR